MEDSTHRGVTVSRVETGVYVARNARGGELRFGSNAGTDFSPVELLLAAIGGCTAVDVDVVTSRRAEPEVFDVAVDAEKVRNDGGNHLEDVTVDFRVQFPEGEAGDLARTLLPRAVAVSHDRTCTVSRSIERGTPVAVRIDDTLGGAPERG